MCTSGSQNTSSACPPRHEQTQSEASSWRLAWFWILYSADTSPGFLSRLWNGEYIAVCQHWTESLYLCLQGIHSPGFQKSLMIPHHPKENTTSNPPKFRFQTCQWLNYLAYLTITHLFPQKSSVKGGKIFRLSERIKMISHLSIFQPFPTIVLPVPDPLCSENEVRGLRDRGGSGQATNWRVSISHGPEVHRLLNRGWRAKRDVNSIKINGNL